MAKITDFDLKALIARIDNADKKAVEVGRKDAKCGKNITAIRANIVDLKKYEGAESNTLESALYRQLFTITVNKIEAVEKYINGVKKVNYSGLAKAILAERRDKETLKRIQERESLREMSAYKQAVKSK